MVEHIKLAAVFHLPFLFAHYIYLWSDFVRSSCTFKVILQSSTLSSLTPSVPRASLFIAKHNHTNTPNDAKDSGKLPRHTQWHGPSVHWDASQSSEGSERERRGKVLRDLEHGCRDLIWCLHMPTWHIISNDMIMIYTFYHAVWFWNI